MNRQEHLLIILAEECAEVIHEVTKSLRFGLDDYWKENPTNKVKLSQELADLFGVYRMLVNEKILDEVDFSKIIDKDQKVETWLLYSKKVGTLTTTDEIYSININDKAHLVMNFVTGKQIKKLAGCDNEHYSVRYHCYAQYPEKYLEISDNELIDLASPDRVPNFKTSFKP